MFIQLAGRFVAVAFCAAGSRGRFVKATSATSSSLVAVEDTNGSYQRFVYHLLTGPRFAAVRYRQQRPGALAELQKWKG